MKRRSTWVLALGAMAVVAMAARAGAETLGASTSEISGANSRTQETTAGNLVADAVRSAVHADIGLVPAGALTENTVKAGNISSADVASLLQRGDDTVSVLSVTGDQIKSALERSVNVYDRPWPGFLQVSGLTVSFDPSRKAGSRVTAVQVNGAPLEGAHKYHVATTHGLAGGGLGYFQIWKGDPNAPDHGTLADVVSAYLKAEGSVAPRVEGRITH